MIYLEINCKTARAPFGVRQIHVHMRCAECIYENIRYLPAVSAVSASLFYANYFIFHMKFLCAYFIFFNGQSQIGIISRDVTRIATVLIVCGRMVPVLNRFSSNPLRTCIT